ncbi:hypothetical protein NSIN_40118 [Nitrosotalea sinensis]|uniref:Uncharacterized protein n=1 Tax=Nitrosotalea sinensis TaxID=1499975 RepID=A0A2H1EIG9_9ARCH|nr:hypothetical protein NSIN_40118 [Candidatus Nitrosotalea sinensis]
MKVFYMASMVRTRKENLHTDEMNQFGLIHPRYPFNCLIWRYSDEKW